MRVPLALRPLAHRDFALLWTGQSLSSLGNSVTGVALPWQVLVLTGSPLQMGIVTGAYWGAQVVLMLFGGAIVDRVPRRAVLLASDLGRGVVIGGVALLGFAGALRVEHLIALSAIFGLFSAFFFPAMGAIVPELVPRDILVTGNALRSISNQGARIAGPLLGGLLIALVGPPAAFAFDAATFFVSFGALLAVSRGGARPAVTGSILFGIASGLRFTFSLPWLWTTIVLAAFGNAVTVGAFAVGLPVLVRDVFHADATALGALTAAVGAGEVAAGIALAQLRIRRIGVAMYLFVGASSIANALYGLAPSIAPLFALSAVGGAAGVGFGVLWESALQRYVPSDLLGRVTSVDYFGSFVLLPIAPVLGGALIAGIGPQPVFLAAGVINLALVLVALVFIPAIRRLE